MTLSVPGGGGVLRAVRMSLATSVRRGAAERWWPLRLMVTSCRGLRARMTRLTLIPVASWM